MVKMIFLVTCCCFFFFSLSESSVRLKTVGGRGVCSTDFISSRRVSLFLEWLSVLHSVAPIALLSAEGQKGVSAYMYLCTHVIHPDTCESCLTCFQFIYPPVGKSLMSFHLQIFFLISLQCRSLSLHWRAMCN